MDRFLIGGCFIVTKCYYCTTQEATHEVEDWSNPGDFSYYCEEHVQLAKSFNREQEENFYVCYKNESTSTWLNETQLRLWEKIYQRKNRQL